MYEYDVMYCEQTVNDMEIAILLFFSVDKNMIMKRKTWKQRTRCQISEQEMEVTKRKTQIFPKTKKENADHTAANH